MPCEERRFKSQKAKCIFFLLYLGDFLLYLGDFNEVTIHFCIRGSELWRVWPPVLASARPLLPSGGSRVYRTRLSLPESVFTGSVFGRDMGLPLTLFDISLFLLLCAVHSNPLWLLNGESWRTFFFSFLLCKDIWQMDSLQTGFCGISTKAISLPFSQSTVNFSYPGLLLVVAEWS